jgi:hypothetical protein
MKTTVIFQLVNTVDTTETEAVEIPSWARAAVLVIPNIAAGAVTAKFIHNDNVTAAKLLASSNTDWVPLQVAIDSVGALKEVMANGDDPAIVDITAFIRGLGDGFIRFTCAGAQGAVTDWKIIFSD